jgi:hypothetical protein
MYLILFDLVLFVQLAIGGVAGSTAAFFTTPFDVVKTRLQTQVLSLVLGDFKTCYWVYFDSSFFHGTRLLVHSFSLKVQYITVAL